MQMQQVKAVEGHMSVIEVRYGRLASISDM